MLTTKDAAGPSLYILHQFTQSCGHQESLLVRGGITWWISSDYWPVNQGDVLPKVVLHQAVSVMWRLLAGYFINCYQQAQNYKMQWPLNTLIPKCYTRDNVLSTLTGRPQDWTPISGLLSLTVTQLRFPSAEHGEVSSAFQWSRTYLHWYIILSLANILVTHHMFREAPCERSIRDRASFTSHFQNLSLHYCCICCFSFLIPSPKSTVLCQHFILTHSLLY